MGKKNQKRAKSSRSASARQTKTTANPRKRQMSFARRHWIKALVAVPTIAVAGTAIHRYDVSSRSIEDLTVVGQGQPTVVQVHDPSCALCRRLMSNTRKALEKRSNLLYRVANIRKPEGANFQRKYGAKNVTLLLFDGRGKLVKTLEGVSTVHQLESEFDQLAIG